MTGSERLFLLLAEELNFTKTAEKAYISQQCLSDHIKRLEDYYGAPLFFRKPSVSLTQAGETVLRTLQIMQTLEEGLKRELHEIEDGTTGTLRIGMNYTRARILLPLLYERYGVLYPHIKIEITLEETVKMQKMLEKGLIDFYLGVNGQVLPPNRSILLANERIYLFASSAYIRKFLGASESVFEAPSEEIDIAMFQGLPFIVNHGISTTAAVINQYLKQCGVSVDTVMAVSDYKISEMICRSGQAASFCPQFYLAELLRENAYCDGSRRLYALPVKNLLSPLRFELIYNGMVHYPKFVTNCMEMLVDIAKQTAV